MIEPFQKDEAFLQDLETADPGAEQFSIWWLAQMGFLLQWRGHRVLIDPYLSESLTRKYADTDKPHIRLTARVVEPGRLERIEAVTASHVHTDHLDPETLRPLAAANPGLCLICPEAIRSVAQERSGLPETRILGLDCSDTGAASSSGAPHHVTACAFTVEAVPAAHEKLDRDANGRLIAIGFIIRFGGWTVYHAGDTVPYDGMANLLGSRRVDLALLPINGRKPERRVTGNLWGREAAQLAKDIGARCAIPGHFDLFGFNTESPTEFVATCERLNQPFALLKNGQRWDSTALA